MSKPPIPTNLAELSPELQRAARWVQAHSSEIALHSLRECARRAGISPSTFSRLSKALGYDSFDAMKQHYQAKLQESAGYFSKANALQSRAKTQHDWLQDVAEIQRENASSVYQRNKARDLLAAARVLLAAPQVHVLGSRASYGLAQHFYYLYHLIAPNAHLLGNEADMLADRVMQCRRGDALLAISFEPYSRNTILTAQAFAQKGAKVIAITDNELSPLATLAKTTLHFQSASASYFQSGVGALALIESLAAACAIAGGKDTIHYLQQMQEHLKAQMAYW